MTELEQAELALKTKNTHLNKCSALHIALTIDKTELNINKPEPSWSPEQRQKLLAKYFELLQAV